MQPYFLLLLSIFCATINNLLLHRFANRGLDSMGDVLLFNALTSAVWIILLGGAGALRDSIQLSAGSLFWGAVYGCVIALFLLGKMQAMAVGPVSLTSFIGCSSLLISTAFGVFILNESASVIQSVGVILLCGALFLIISPKTADAKPSWKYWCALFYFGSAATGIIFKLHQRSDAAAQVDEMLLISAVTSALMLCAAAVIMTRRDGRLPKVPSGALGYAVMCGAVGCIYNRLNITLTGTLPSVVFFPLFNGSVIVLSTLAGVILFGERLNRKQIYGILLGTAALMLASGTVDGIAELISDARAL